MTEELPEISISAELTEKGIKAATNSRFLRAIDRLFGGLVERIGHTSHLYRSNARDEAALKMIEAAGQYGVDKIKQDDEFANRVFDNNFSKFLREQSNKDAVINVAIEDLRTHPDREQNGDENLLLSEDFLNRFETYAAEASSDELRQKWGKVLAAEVRQPGTFSNKVLRVVDELDFKTAKLFEDVCSNRLGNTLPHYLTHNRGQIDYEILGEAGLILSLASFGFYRQFVSISLNNGDQVLAADFGLIGAGVRGKITINPDTYPSFEPFGFSAEKKEIEFRFHLLTEAGQAIASILPDQQKEAAKEFAYKLSEFLDNAEVVILQRKKETSLYEPVEKIRAAKDPLRS